jgi:hypothetical protein
MNADELRSVQAPLKDQYRQTPDTALITLRAQGRLDEGVSCKIETGMDSWLLGCTLRREEPASAPVPATCF